MRMTRAEWVPLCCKIVPYLLDMQCASQQDSVDGVCFESHSKGKVISVDRNRFIIISACCKPILFVLATHLLCLLSCHFGKLFFS
jgi:hypothetical protein